MKGLMPFLLAAALVAPQIGLANESVLQTNNDGERGSKIRETLPLPPIRYLEAMPWINLETQSKWRGIDTLLPLDLKVQESKTQLSQAGKLN